jgi:hypothetical protein
MKQFFTGAPPHVGWWFTQVKAATYVQEWRWFDGEVWSTGVSGFDGIEAARLSAKCESLYEVHELEWSTYYPENARVPRLDPTGLSQKEIDRFYTYAASAQEQYLDGLTVYHTDLNGMWKRFTGDIVLGHPRRNWWLVDLTSLSAVSLKNFKAHLI